jgi:hypothetical protein
MPGVRERLDQVPWSRLSHAYGSAQDVPDQLTALRSADADRRADALRSLYGSIFHQGTVFEATAHAVPFLLDLVADPATPGRADLLGLLGRLAVGDDEQWLPEQRPAAAGVAAEVVLDTYAAVRAGVPLLGELLGDADPAVRTGAAYLLAWFPDDAARTLPALAVLAQRDDHAPAVAAALLAIGLLGGQPDPAALTDTRRLVRWGAAVALARTDGPGADPRVADELLSWAGGAVAVDRRMPFLDGDLGGYAAMALRQIGVWHADALFDALLGRVGRVAGADVMPVLGEALSVAFPHGATAAGTTAADLDERQLRLVTALAESPTIWWVDGLSSATVGMLLHAYGLPTDSTAMLSFLSGR